MDCFLSVGKGSDKKAMFVELHYNGCQDNEKKVVLVGKGKIYLWYLKPFFILDAHNCNPVKLTSVLFFKLKVLLESL